MNKFENMGKVELRTACKEAGIKNYSKMDNAGMRAALVANAKKASKEHSGEKKAANGFTSSVSQLMVANGLAKAPESPKRSSSKPAPAAKADGTKIEKNREEKHGVKRPSAGGLCRAVWDALDEFLAKNKVQPTAKDVKAMAAANEWNSNNASIEYYQWRKFHGIAGRAAKK